MFTTDLVNLYNRNIFKTSLIYIFQDEKCILMRILSLSMDITVVIATKQIGLPVAIEN